MRAGRYCLFTLRYCFRTRSESYYPADAVDSEQRCYKYCVSVSNIRTTLAGLRLALLSRRNVHWVRSCSSVHTNYLLRRRLHQQHAGAGARSRRMQIICAQRCV
jgi:hypothetical protein